MTDKIIENNQVEIMGKIASRFTFSHQVFGEGFYMVDVLVKRLSDSEDRIPVMISERLVDVNEDYEGEYIHVMGQFRSYNRHEEKKNRLVLSVFAREVEFVEDDDENMKSNARYASAFQVGGHVLIWGRIQSREYVKKISEEETQKRIAYEISVSKLEYAD